MTTGREQTFAVVPIDDKPLNRQEVHDLATFNGQKHTGLLHTTEHRARMAILQARFDKFGYERPARKRWWQRG